MQILPAKISPLRKKIVSESVSITQRQKLLRPLYWLREIRPGTLSQNS